MKRKDMMSNRAWLAMWVSGHVGALVLVILAVKALEAFG